MSTVLRRTKLTPAATARLIDETSVRMSPTTRLLAVELQRLNEPQIRRMEMRVRKMPLPVLRKHGVVSVDRDLVRLNVEAVTSSSGPT